MKRYNKICECCETEIHTYSATRRFCDSKCAHKYKYIKVDRIFYDIICGICNKEFMSVYSHSKYCSDKCKKKNSMRREKERRITQASFGDIPNFRIFERDKFTCIYCGKSSIEDAKELHIDHIRPQSKDGKHTISNLVTACKTCNSTKKDVLLSKKIEQRIKKEVKRRNVLSGYV